MALTPKNGVSPNQADRPFCRAAGEIGGLHPFREGKTTARGAPRGCIGALSSSRHLLPGSSVQQTPQRADRWVRGQAPG